MSTPFPDVMQPPTLEPSAAAALVRHGGTVVCLNVPAGTRVGLDYAEWAVGPKFVGMKMLPPGPHFLWYSAASKLGDLAPRSGFFFVLDAGEIVVTRWDPTTEQLTLPTHMDKDEVERVRAGVRRNELDAGLGAYPLKTHKTWKSLTNFCSRHHVERVCGQQGELQSTAALVTSESADHEACRDVPSLTSAARRLDAVTSSEKQFAFSRLRGYGPGSEAADVTQFAMDTSVALTRVLHDADTTGVLAELQLSFVGFVQGQSLEAFEHWKGLVLMLCRCEDALSAAITGSCATLLSSFFPDAYRTLQSQLAVMPKDAFSDDLTKQHFLRSCFQSLYEITAFQPVVSNADVMKSASDLLSMAKLTFGWLPSAVRPHALPNAVFCEDGVETLRSKLDRSTVDVCEDTNEYDDEDGPVVVDLEATML